MKVAQRQSPEHQARDRKRAQPGRRSQEDEGRKQKPMEGLLLTEIWRLGAAEKMLRETNPQQRSTRNRKEMEVGSRAKQRRPGNRDRGLKRTQERASSAGVLCISDSLRNR